MGNVEPARKPTVKVSQLTYDGGLRRWLGILLSSLPLMVGLLFTGFLASRSMALDHGLMLVAGGAIALAVSIAKSRLGRS